MDRRTILDEVKKRLRLPPFNLVGDGVTDDSKVLQAYIDAKIPVPPGRYAVGQTLRIDRKVHPTFRLENIELFGTGKLSTFLLIV